MIKKVNKNFPNYSKAPIMKVLSVINVKNRAARRSEKWHEDHKKSFMDRLARNLKDDIRRRRIARQVTRKQAKAHARAIERKIKVKVKGYE